MKTTDLDLATRLQFDAGTAALGEKLNDDESLCQTAVRFEDLTKVSFLSQIVGLRGWFKLRQ